MLFLPLQIFSSCSPFSAPNRPPGNVSWKIQGSQVAVRWDHVTAMHNESAVLGYKVSGLNKKFRLEVLDLCVFVCGQHNSTTDLSCTNKN